jgi:adenylylsulfate kinase
MKILIMGLPGAGKSWLAERLQHNLKCAWYNADKIREAAMDWDFSIEGRYRQAMRMRSLADFEVSHNRLVICDFVCPTVETRKMFDPQLLIWMNTLEKGRFEDTNQLFQPPTEHCDIEIKEFIKDSINLQRIEMMIRNKFDV